MLRPRTRPGGPRRHVGRRWACAGDFRQECLFAPFPAALGLKAGGSGKHLRSDMLRAPCNRAGRKSATAGALGVEGWLETFRNAFQNARSPQLNG